MTYLILGVFISLVCLSENLSFWDWCFHIFSIQSNLY